MKVTVITVCLNAEATVGDAVASVAAQKGVAVEHILVDGASSDATVARARQVGGAALKVISEPDNGLYEAMNKGIRAATGDLIGFLNADDFFCRTDALALLSALPDDCQAASGGVAIVEATDISRVRRAYAAVGFQPWMIRFGHMPPHPAFYVRRDALLHVGPFNTARKIGADFDWMARFFLVKRMKVSFVRQTLVAVRSGGLSTRGFSSMRIINREAGQSLRSHGLASNALLVWSKYLAKGLQLLRRAPEYPADPPVRWAPSYDTASDSRTAR